jgi:hypothetical protein
VIKVVVVLIESMITFDGLERLTRVVLQVAIVMTKVRESQGRSEDKRQNEWYFVNKIVPLDILTHGLSLAWNRR